ncbi:MAG: aldehyde dehydrogenase [Planctomycetes bacterium]|nr:aldehyde dehydrogenase [Planctomycetota bacterium]
MLHIPILRHGKPYTSVETVEILHHATGEPVARVSQANSGMITRDVGRWDHRALERFTVAQLVEACSKAATIFMTATLPLGEVTQSFDDYIGQLSATTGMPVTLCRNNADKIRRMFAEMQLILAGLTRGFDLSILDRGYGDDDRRTLSWFREARTFGAVLPSNSPGVHSLWMPAIPLKTPVVLKPGREEPWSPWRIIQSFIAAGLPAEAFGFYPTDHGGAAALLRAVDRAMLFGDTSTTKPWANDHRVELHGPGFSKVLLGDDAAKEWSKYVEVIASSIVANGGRSCINASAVWTPSHGREIAEAVAKELAKVQALPAENPEAKIAAFANPKMPELISASIDGGLREAGAEDVTQRIRGTPRLVTIGRCAYLLPTVIRCDRWEHPLANREFLFPYASVVECPTTEMLSHIGPTLIGTVITRDKRFITDCMACGDIDRLNVGAIPTWRISWDQPHEGNLFEHLYRQRAFQIEHAA